MKKVIIDYSDGLYSFYETELIPAEDDRVIEVLESTFVMWCAISELNRVLQKQLQELTND